MSGTSRGNSPNSLNILWAPFIGEKRSYSFYRVHGTQNDRHKFTVLTQKSVLKNLHQLLRYLSICVKIWRFGLVSQILIHFDYYLWIRYIFFKTYLCWNHELKLVVLSTINPINGTTIFLPIKGAHAILNEFGLFPQAVSDQVPFVKNAYI